MVLKNPNHPPMFLRTEEFTGQATIYLKKAENQIFIKNTMLSSLKHWLETPHPILLSTDNDLKPQLVIYQSMTKN